MKLISVISFLTVAADAMSSLGPCSVKKHGPCSCPTGTEYAESVTYATIGAKASDVKALIMDFFDPAWLGVIPIKTIGRDNTPGKSVRVAYLPTGEGIYEFSEILDILHLHEDGSFFQVFEQLPSSVPIKYHGNNGSFSGYWVTLESTAIFEYETAIRWSAYACSTGHPIEFANFHESALSNATDVLTQQGKVKGINLKPASVQNF